MTSLPPISLAVSTLGILSLYAGRTGPPMDPWPSQPDDRERSHEEVVSTAPHKHEVVMDAAVDGVMTRMPVGYSAYHQGWQPNRFLRLENTGETDVVNPWITVNGKRNWRTLADMAREAVGAYKTDADKARAVWEFTRHHRFHATTWGNESNDAVKVFNVYGYTLCGNDAQVIADVWKAAGLKTRRGYPVGHCVSEAFYDGEYHLLDGDEHCIYLRRDNRTIASEAEIVRDHDLIKRTHTYGVGARHDPPKDEFSASLFGYEGPRKGEHGGRTKHTMVYVLRPGESIEWRWDHTGKQYTYGTPAPDGKWRKDGQGDLAVWGRDAYANMRNGKMRYAPDLGRPLARRGLHDSVGLAAPGKAGLGPEKAGVASHATWRVASPYVIVGGKAAVRYRRGGEGDRLSISVGHDGEAWQTIWEAGATGEAEDEIVFDELLSPRERPQYAYYLRVEMEAAQTPSSVRLEAITFETDLQMAALAMPELEAGRNTVRYVDETEGARQVKITHGWVERPSWHPPAAPRPTVPAEGAALQGTQVRFAWERPAGSDGDDIVQYRIQLSAHQDMRWYLSPNFDRLVSKGTQWLTPYVGLLNPGSPYFWRVRAKDAKGVWGPWSRPRSFSCDAPGVPLNVTARAEPKAGTVLLTWEANPEGAVPVRYKVYASNEKGFSVSDTDYRVRMGRGFCTTMEEYEAKGKVKDMVDTPANLALTTGDRKAMVVGPDLDIPNANRAFYRVVAVDARGLESGPSDYAETPRPLVHTRPPPEATVGREYSYEPGCLLSIGDLRCKRGYNSAFWDRELATFALRESPGWLQIEPATGRVSGTPPAGAVGTHDVVLRVAIGEARTVEQRFELQVAGAEQ